MAGEQSVNMDHLAALARIELSSDEKATFAVQLDTILDYFRALQGVDVTGIEPMAHPFEVTAPLRDDIPGTAWPAERGLLNAPLQRDDQLVVPRVIEEA